MSNSVGFSHPIIDKLELPFKEPAIKTLLDCAECGIQMRPFFGVRTPQEQARLWRQGRTKKEIMEATLMLADAGAMYLAQCITDVGPQHGRQVTNALPGNSWHQFGLALDCFWTIDGKAEWSMDRVVRVSHSFPDGDMLDGMINGYSVYAVCAERNQLTSGYRWQMRDGVHIQGPCEASPRNMYEWPKINELMKERFA